MLRPFPLPSIEIPFENIEHVMKQDLCASLARNQLVADVLLAFQK